MQTAEERFADQMKALRVAEGLTQAALAAKLGEVGMSIDNSAIARIEKGQRSLRLNEADLIAKVLGRRLQDVLDARCILTPALLRRNLELIDKEAAVLNQQRAVVEAWLAQVEDGALGDSFD